MTRERSEQRRRRRRRDLAAALLGYFIARHRRASGMAVLLGE
jgi:hypothetical protein